LAKSKNDYAHCDDRLSVLANQDVKSFYVLVCEIKKGYNKIMRKQFNVTTKAAVYSKGLQKVLVIHMDRDDKWGLPGGHMEENETPDEAMARELFEECGVKAVKLERKDFFMHLEWNKLILSYVVEIENDNIKSQQDNLEGIPKWLTKSKFNSIQIDQNYRDFILNNWPKQ